MSVVQAGYFAALAIEQEEQGRNLFPSGSFDAAHANFTVRIELAAPSLNFNAASTGGRQSVAYAFGAESIDSQSVRYTAYVDATTGQLMFSLAQTGDALP